MELQFQKNALHCLHTVLRKTQTQEQTQELRISDGMPDIGSVLGAWGQVILRGKEWDADILTVNGGTMIWAMYAPEEGGQPQTVEGWIPFQMRFDIPSAQRDGVILTQCQLKSVDGRSTSARKLILRSNVSVLIHAVCQEEKELFAPTDVPEDVQLRTASYPILLPSEAGEKAFSLEESFPQPTNGPNPAKLLSCQLQPEITEHRIMGDKAVFRGNGLVHILYETEDGTIHSCDYDLPFSQYSELDQVYDEDAQAVLWPAVTALETDLDEGRIHIKTGLVCQYMIRHRPLVQIVEDAYSPLRSVQLQQQELQLPGILESKTLPIHIHSSDPVDGMRTVSVQMLPQSPSVTTKENAADIQTPVHLQTLYFDMEGQPRFHSVKNEEHLAVPVGQGSRLEASVWPIGRPQGNLMSGNLQHEAVLQLQMDTVMDTALAMVTGLELGELQEPDPNRPSLILRRAGERTLWDLAKAAGSTVEDIRSANGLTAEPEGAQMLLIPVK